MVSYLVLNERIIVSDELEGMWKEAVVTCLNILSQQWYHGTEFKPPKTPSNIIGLYLSVGN